MQDVKKVWERRSHAFPPHYTPEWKVKSEEAKSAWLQEDVLR